MAQEFTQKINGNQLNLPEKGLREPDLDEATGRQELACPECKKKAFFYPAKFYWDTDDEFEFCDVICPECKGVIEINALSAATNYYFFPS